MISARSLLCRTAAILALPLAAAPLLAQATDAPTGASKPAAATIDWSIPDAKDVPYPGTIKLSVDATDLQRRVFRVEEVIPVRPGKLVLLYPRWLPGAHSPRGQIDKVAGLTITAGGKTIPWKRDPVEVTAFHVNVPDGVDSITARFQFLSATAENQGTVVITPNALALEWISTMLYPAGYYTRQIMVEPSATYPAGWTSATSLRPSGKETAAGGTIRYAPVAVDTLADSPVFAGRHSRIEDLGQAVTLNIFAERPDQLAIKPEQLAQHKALVTQAVKLFGSRHFNHYDFLYVLSDRIGGFGLEHHRSSENSASPDIFLDWKNKVAEVDLLAHEFTHSWNGKFRRGDDAWTPDFRTPMQNSMLWVYEGQTQFWGNVLAARSGMVPKEDALDALASVAASYDTLPGRTWRPLVDTTNEPIISGRRPVPFKTYLRGEDYYQEGQLVWLDADSLIRERSKGKRSLDDFARTFFGVRDGDWGEMTYTFDDVVAALNKVEPYDWATFLKERVYTLAPKAPLAGLERGGYRLTYTEDPSHYWKSREGARHVLDLSYSLGMTIGREGRVTAVQWDSPAFKAGITVGTTLTAIEGEAYSDGDLKAAIKTAKGGTQPIHLLIKQGDAFRTVDVQWNGGLRYPTLEKIPGHKGPSWLDALYTARK